MSEMQNSSSIRSVLLIVRGVWIESIRQKDILALGVLMGIYFLGVSVIRMVGIDNPATGTFLYNLGLTLTGYCAHVIALLSAGRQIPDELENRTIYPILAKPVSRTEFLVGKWLAATSFGWVVAGSLAVLVYLMTPQLESYSSLMGWQALSGALVSIAVITAWALLLSLMFPKPLTFVLIGLWFFLGEKLIAILETSLSTSSNLTIVAWISEYLPNFARWNLWTRYTDGIESLSVGVWAGTILYGILFMVIPLVISDHLFRRKPL